MYIFPFKLNSTFGMITKATGIKMTAKALHKNSSFHLSLKNSFEHPLMPTKHVYKNFEHFFGF